MKYLGIDFGTKNIGLALSDEQGRLSFAYQTLNVQLSKKSAQEKIVSDIGSICKLEKIDRIVVGLPLGLSGNSTETTNKAVQFASLLEKQTAIPVDVEDERLTSIQAARLPDKNARSLDELSAQILLQSYLDKNNQ